MNGAGYAVNYTFSNNICGITNAAWPTELVHPMATHTFAHEKQDRGKSTLTSLLSCNLGA